MKHLRIVVLFLFASGCCYSQDTIDNVNEYIYNHVYKNIIAFNIRYASYPFNGLIIEDMDEGGYIYIMPDHGYKLKMDIQKIDSAYPDPRYHLYKIYMNRFEFIPDDPKLDVIGSSVLPKFNYYLVALNERNGDIKYISGQFFHSYITANFHINLKDPKTFITYLNFRTFDVGGVNIRYKKRKHRQWIFEGYSTVFEAPLTISVKRKNPDFTNITIETKSSK